MNEEKYGTQFVNAAGDTVVLPPEASPVTSESKLTHIINHVKEFKLLYIALLVGASYMVYKKFIKK